jgi:hypothetical protein
MLGRPSVIGLAGHMDNGIRVRSGLELSVALEVASALAERGDSNAAKVGSSGGGGGGESRTE